jgi:hypothetical protein
MGVGSNRCAYLFANLEGLKKMKTFKFRHYPDFHSIANQPAGEYGWSHEHDSPPPIP